MSIYAGHCFCGSVKFEVAGPEKYACFCHCESCQRAAGAVYVPWATFEKKTFVITAGEMIEYNSSSGVTRGFCRECGTSLTYEHEKRAGDIDITLTSFDNPSQFAPRAHIWVEDKLPWVVIGDDLPQFPQTAR